METYTMEQLLLQLDFLQHQIYLLLGSVICCVIAILVYVFYRFRKATPLSCSVVKRIYTLSMFDDDEASYIVPLSHVVIREQQIGLVVEHVTVVLRNTDSQPVLIEQNVNGVVADISLVSEHRMPYVGMSEVTTCFVKQNSSHVLVESTLRRQLLPIADCSIVQVSFICEFTTDSMELQGLRLHDIGSEYIFVPVIIYRQFFLVKTADFTQIYRWDGNNYRMIDARGRYFISPVMYTETVSVRNIVLLPRRPAWYYSPEMM